jgi:two-component system, OmpR family, flagellar system response regulator FtcR
MYVLIDRSELVAQGFSSSLYRQGIPLLSFQPEEFESWVSSASLTDIYTIEAFLVGSSDLDEVLPKLIQKHSRAPIIALREQPSLDQTIALFKAGADDVVRKPIQIRELLARVEAIRRRERTGSSAVMIGQLRIYFDARPPEVDGVPLTLPRRERRILELLAAHRGKWLTKQHVFSATYGLFDDKVLENVVESHISKLRRKLVASMSTDPIESKRYLGYRIA